MKRKQLTSFKFLKRLHTSTPRQRMQLIKTVNREGLNQVRAACHNIVCGRVKMDKKRKRKLKKYKHIIRALGNKNIKYKNTPNLRKRILMKGGLFPALGIILPALASLLTHAGTKLIDKVVAV